MAQNLQLSHLNPLDRIMPPKNTYFVISTFPVFFLGNTRSFYKQHFYKQRQVEIGKKLSKS